MVYGLKVVQIKRMYVYCAWLVEDIFERGEYKEDFVRETVFDFLTEERWKLTWQ